MSTESSPYLYWIGGAFSAVILSITSATIMWFVEKKIPTIKTVGRDLILGAILFFLLLQLLPESTMSLVTSILAVVATTDSINSVVTSNPVAAAVEDVELRLGVPSF
jgi:hypothetical protein